jgi:hypothetical protein
MSKKLACEAAFQENSGQYFMTVLLNFLMQLKNNKNS